MSSLYYTPKTQKLQPMHKTWTELEKSIIRSNPSLTDKELALLLPPHKVESIRKCRQRMGLLKSPGRPRRKNES